MEDFVKGVYCNSSDSSDGCLIFKSLGIPIGLVIMKFAPTLTMIGLDGTVLLYLGAILAIWYSVPFSVVTAKLLASLLRTMYFSLRNAF